MHKDKYSRTLILSTFWVQCS